MPSPGRTRNERQADQHRRSPGPAAHRRCRDARPILASAAPWPTGSSTAASSPAASSAPASATSSPRADLLRVLGIEDEARLADVQPPRHARGR
jgi:hypothetical protein